jgi:hypothetical protein
MGELGDELAQLYRRLVSQRFPRTKTPAGESGGVIDRCYPKSWTRRRPPRCTCAT